ncbi:MAG: hypothetical protein HQL43_08770 [Alphaproteobacteria bacterium]|nr:hypothetical protein [Alphaproteobacteria bacterium]
MAGLDEVLKVITDATLAFPDNRLCRRVLAGQITRGDYHKVLLTLFHISHEAPNVSALAAAQCPIGMEEVRDYLLRHAERARDNWRWVMSDLEATDYAGPDPRGEFPIPAVQAFVAYNYYVALRLPAGRMAIIAMLNALLSNFGQNYSAKLFQILSLKPTQASFFYRGQPADDGLMDVLRQAPIPQGQWPAMANAARTAAKFYTDLYDGVLA